MRRGCATGVCITRYLGALAIAGSFGASADAAQRTFVASYGSESGACTLAAPCRSFAAAIANTDADGEIIVLDSAGYGRVTIDRSVSIVAPPGVYAGISVFSATNGVDVDGVGIVVVLRGLTINGQGGDDGISFVQGARLYIDRCVVSNMNRGVYLAAGETHVTNSTIVDNDFTGIHAESATELAIDRTRIEGTSVIGVRALNGPRVAVTNSFISGNGTGVSIRSDDGASETVGSVTDSSLSHNGTAINGGAQGAGSIVRLAVARNTMSWNSSNGLYMESSAGTLTATVNDNTILRSNRGIYALGAGVSATLATNAISANVTAGIAQLNNALLRTRANNVVQDNATDVSGTLTFVAGD